jgi:hypothetical protein
MKVGAFQTRIAQKLRQLLVVGALAICVCSLFPAGAIQTASALTMCIKPRGGVVEVDKFMHYLCQNQLKLLAAVLELITI